MNIFKHFIETMDNIDNNYRRGVSIYQAADMRNKQFHKTGSQGIDKKDSNEIKNNKPLKTSKTSTIMEEIQEEDEVEKKNKTVKPSEGHRLNKEFLEEKETTIPSVPNIPNVPGIPNAPKIFVNPNVPKIPNLPKLPVPKIQTVAPQKQTTNEDQSKKSATVVKMTEEQLLMAVKLKPVQHQKTKITGIETNIIQHALANTNILDAIRKRREDITKHDVSDESGSDDDWSD